MTQETWEILVRLKEAIDALAPQHDETCRTLLREVGDLLATAHVEQPEQGR